MTAPTRPSPPTPPTLNGRDWTVQAADSVESLVLAVKDKTTVPAMTAVRAIVYGIVIAALAAVMLIVMSVAIMRLIDVYLLGWAGTVRGQRREYIAYLALGLIFTLAGLVCWSRRVKKVA